MVPALGAAVPAALRLAVAISLTESAEVPASRRRAARARARASSWSLACGPMSNLKPRAGGRDCHGGYETVALQQQECSACVP